MRHDGRFSMSHHWQDRIIDTRRDCLYLSIGVRTCVSASMLQAYADPLDVVQLASLILAVFLSQIHGTLIVFPPPVVNAAIYGVSIFRVAIKHVYQLHNDCCWIFLLSYWRNEARKDVPDEFLPSPCWVFLKNIRSFSNLIVEYKMCRLNL